MNRLICVVPLLLLAGGATASADDAIVLARVAGEPVTSVQLERQFSERHSGHSMFLLGTSEIRRFLDQVIDDRLLVQEAFRLELDRDPEIVSGLDDLRSRKAAERLIRELVDAEVATSDAEVRSVWENELGKVRDLLEIVVATENEAKAVAAKLAGGENFESLARELSIARSRIRGGRLPPAGWGSHDPVWERVAFGLAPGATSAPFESAEGWTIVRLLEIREVERPELAKVQEQVRALLEKRRLEAKRDEVRTELWSKYAVRRTDGVDLSPASLSSLLEAAPTTRLASWNGGELTLSAFIGRPELEQIEARSDAVQFLGRLLERTVTGALAAVEAKARGLDRLPEVEAEVAQAREILMLGKLYSDHLLRGLEVTEPEVRAWYEGHRDEHLVAERRRTSQIVVATEQEAAEILTLLSAGGDFAQIAKERSKDAASGRSGGDLGWIAVDEIPEEMAAIRDLPVGGTSQPIATRFGWHLIRVTEVEPARPRELEEVAASLRAQLFERKKTERRREWVQQLREATEIVVDDEAIADLARRATEEAKRSQSGS